MLRTSLRVEITKVLKRLIRVAKRTIIGFTNINAHGLTTRALLAEIVCEQRLSSCKNDFAKKYARKHFSQTDEDGITIEIINRIKSTNKTFCNSFAEFGVGDGLENNTLVLLSLGWKGSWFGGESLAFNPKDSSRLNFHKTWITKENVISLCQQSLKDCGSEKIEVISLDLDGNDHYLLQTILNASVKPSLFIVEYNAIFPVGADWKIRYNEWHQFKNDQYFGASLESLIRLFSDFGYFLVACNPRTGANAFFVRNEYRHLFPDIPDRIEDIYVSPFYNLDNNNFTHRISPEFIKSIIL